jgi:DNA-directed RNA polymerase subunit RPC12/RpoP
MSIYYWVITADDKFLGRKCPITRQELSIGHTLYVCSACDTAFLSYALQEYMDSSGNLQCPGCHAWHSAIEDLSNPGSFILPPQTRYTGEYRTMGAPDGGYGTVGMPGVRGGTTVVPGGSRGDTQPGGVSGTAMQAWVVEMNGQHRGQVHRLERGRCIIGRDPSLCDIALDDPKVSRVHAAIQQEGNRMVIQDLGSLNHTYVNGQLIQRQVLSDTDEIICGTSARLRFLCTGT